MAGGGGGDFGVLSRGQEGARDVLGDEEGGSLGGGHSDRIVVW